MHDPQQHHVRTNSLGWRDGLVLLLLAVVIGTVYGPELSGRRSFFYFDISSMNLPMRHWGFAQIRAGHFPEWCRHLGTGFPFVAESQTGICYPIHYLTFGLFASERAFAYDLLIHLWLAAAGMYAFLRLHVSRLAAFAPAILWCLGGRMLVHQIHTPFFCTMSWLTINIFLIECWLRSLDRDDRPAADSNWLLMLAPNRWLILATASLGMQMLAGSFQQVLLNQMLVGGWVLLSIIERRRWRFMVPCAFGMMLYLILGGMLGGVLLMPTLELLPMSLRAGVVDEEMARWGSARPQVWVEWLCPDLFGSRGSATAWVSSKLPWQEVGLHLGVWAIPAALASLMMTRTRWQLKLAGLGLMGFMLAIGNAHPLFAIVRALPILSSTRMPVRFSILVAFALCGLLASFLQSLLTSKPERATWYRRPMIATTLVLLVLSIVAGLIVRQSYQADLLNIFLPELSTQARPRGNVQSTIVQLSRDVRASLINFAVVVAAGFVALSFARRWPTVAICMLSVIMTADVAQKARDHWPTIEPSFHQPGKAITWLQQQRAQRVFAYQQATDISSPGYHVDPHVFDRARDGLYWERGPMYEIGVVHPILSVPLGMKRWFEFVDACMSSPNFLNVIAADFVQTLEPTSGADLASQAEFAQPGLHYYRPKRIGAYARIVPSAVMVNNSTEALKRLADPSFDPNREVVVNEDAGHTGAAQTITGATANPPTPVDQSRIHATWLSPNLLEVHWDRSPETIALGQTHWLVVAETSYPGWSAVNQANAERPLFIGNGHFMAVKLQPGDTIIRLRFASNAIRRGLMCTLLSATILLVLLVWTKIPRKRREPELDAMHDANPTDDSAGAGHRILGVVVASLLVILVFGCVVANQLQVITLAEVLKP